MGKRKRTRNRKKEREKKQIERTKSALELALEKVELVFQVAELKEIGIKKKKLRKETYISYKKSMATMLTDISKMEGPNYKRLSPTHMNGKMWDKYFEHLIDRYDKGSLSAGQIQRRIHALELFRKTVNDTDLFGIDITIRVGNKEERLDYLKERGVLRSQDEVTAIKPTKRDIDAVQAHFNTSTRNGKISLVINQLQEECGGRIKSIFKLLVNDIDFEKKKITFRNDKNNFTRTIPMTVAAEKLLRDACDGKKPGSPVFALQHSNGNDMNLENAVETVQRYTKNAAKKAGVSREERRFTTHSNRKYYAQKLYDSIRFMSTYQIRKMIGEYVRAQGSNEEIIIERMRKELDRINYYRKKHNLPKRGLTHEQYRKMCVSLHLGHSRISVLSSYIVVDKYQSKNFR
ncbi:tyrosine-type recombinase/integrase [Neobacillus sp. KR4-4]|uniref:tyrosine-type recombinase/integrase n=1 Tax=Neobacillus sp. KR4-4 TaxID=3344872 RepID=UPI0035CBF1AC